MSRYEKLLADILNGAKDKNISFSDFQAVLKRLGFQCRVKGDHFIYTQEGIEEILNVQPAGSQVKPYQVKQAREIILRYQLGGRI